MIYRHQPCDTKKMDEQNEKYTICQVLREIYHKAVDEESRMLCRIAVTMAKAMDGKLRQYKEDWDKEFWGEA